MDTIVGEFSALQGVGPGQAYFLHSEFHFFRVCLSGLSFLSILFYIDTIDILFIFE